MFNKPVQGKEMLGETHYGSASRDCETQPLNFSLCTACADTIKIYFKINPIEFSQLSSQTFMSKFDISVKIKLKAGF